MEEKTIVCENGKRYKVNGFGLFPSRYQADKARKNDPWHRSDERIVKVYGGYTLMDEAQYRTWKGQV